MIVAIIIFASLAGAAGGFYLACAWYKVLREEWD